MKSFLKEFPSTETFDYILDWLHQNKVQRLTPFQIEKIIIASHSKFRKVLFEKITKGVCEDWVQLYKRTNFLLKNVYLIDLHNITFLFLDFVILFQN